MGDSIIRLDCDSTSLDWGKVGQASVAAKLASSTSTKIENDKPYSELWIGTHPPHVSKRFGTDQSLLDILKDNGNLLESGVPEQGKLPCVVKVLSIGKPQGVQTHPEKDQAAKLHAKDPEHYPDSGSNQILTVALAPYEGLCNFRPLGEISYFLTNIAPLRDLIGSETCDNFTKFIQPYLEIRKDRSAFFNEDCDPYRKALETLFTTFMTNAASTAKLEPAARALIELTKSYREKFAAGGASDSELSGLIQRLNAQYPADVGLFMPMFLNYFRLQQDGALCANAGDPYAHLSGDAIEISLPSDTVVRAGLTADFKDADDFMQSLSYKFEGYSIFRLENGLRLLPSSEMKLNHVAEQNDSSAGTYHKFVSGPDCCVTDMKHGGHYNASAQLKFGWPMPSSILICWSGQASIEVGEKTQTVKAGETYFVGSGEPVYETKSASFKAYHIYGSGFPYMEVGMSATTAMVSQPGGMSEANYMPMLLE